MEKTFGPRLDYGPLYDIHRFDRSGPPDWLVRNGASTLSTFRKNVSIKRSSANQLRMMYSKRGRHYSLKMLHKTLSEETLERMRSEDLATIIGPCTVQFEKLRPAIFLSLWAAQPVVKSTRPLPETFMISNFLSEQ